MDNPDIGSGDAVIHRTQRLIINGVGYDAVLTDKRIILVDTDSGKTRVTIPYSDITLASAETNKLREPVIRITYNSPDGSTRGIELIFIFLAAGRNLQNRDRCITVLDKQGVMVRPDPNPSDFYSRAKRERMDAGTLDAEQPSGRPPVPEWTVYGPAQGTRQAPSDEPKAMSPVITIAAVIILAAILVAAMITPLPEPAPPSWSKTGSAQGTVSPTPTPAMGPAPEITPEPVQTTQTPAPVETLAPGAVPGNGVWIKTSYAGSYTGFLAAGGQRIEVNSSGTQIYQMPVHDTIIDIFLEKEDGSGDLLAASVFNGGVPIDAGTTTAPRGVLEMHVPVGPAIVNTTAPVAPVPTTAATPSPTVASRYRIPSSGIWLHVLYPGEYTGSFSFNGQTTPVSSTGEQIFQIPITRGVIDGIFTKADGSTDTLAVEVYKEGAIIDLANTTASKGIVEIHTMV